MDNISRFKNSGHSRKVFTFSIALLVCATLFFIVSTFIFLRDADRDAKYLEIASDMRVLLHQISTSSRAATAGDASAFSTLKKATERFDRSYRILLAGDNQLPGVGTMMKSELQELSSIWIGVKKNSETIVNNRDRILFLHDVAKTLNESIPELQREYNRVVEVLLDRNASNEQIVYAQKQLLLAERIARNVDKMLSGGEATSQAADQFNLDASIFGGVLTGMLEGDKQLGLERIKDEKARASLERINTLFDFVSGSVDDIFKASPDLLGAKNAADGILNNSPKILDKTNSVVEGLGSLSQRRTVGADTAFFSGALILIILAVIGTQLYRNTVSRLAEEKNANERNQIAIERLLNEIGNLADGDLTAEATVSEDFTGAIADSINYTIEQLRDIISSINDTTVKVDSAAKETQTKALTLAEASESQASEIASASGAVKEMAGTMDKMSIDASESATVAQSSVQIAKSGANVVQNTIHGMDTIREQIQDTSKRVKRLGESSQEIGDIVSLINDIADQTNILALNASIQASMAGEAGRGFAVVADEVQRLAERSSAATRQIEALVKTIQSDTNEAAASMEQTTAEVVNGAGLAHDAGVALEEIEKVSLNLSELIESISSSARTQADTAGNISLTMNTVKDITSQTAAGTTDAADKVGNLSSMTKELRGSVAGFKLPGVETDYPTVSTIENDDDYIQEAVS
ncbi:MAG: chemotaxis protein [Cellvibrionales bacterium]|jgi:twitching motility protein PilJ|nr:chemotaxis protein [Cellvibrionales bacterium]MBT5923178.1 chemotaxis protein [Cellvibrionales bacterium]MBT6579032.1 chemotaxis protein [Cellvibrionales bacterium]